MPERYPYPERERVDLSTDTVSDALRFELGIHANGPEFRYGLKAITAIYASSPLLRSIRQTSRLVALSHAYAGVENKSGEFDTEFYQGALLGMHITLRPLQSDLKMNMMCWELYPQYVTSEGGYRFNEAALLMAAQNLHTWCAGEFYSSLYEEPDDFQQLIIEAAIKMYDDCEDSGIKGESFIAGFMMAKDTIVQNLFDLKRSVQSQNIK